MQVIPEHPAEATRRGFLKLLCAGVAGLFWAPFLPRGSLAGREVELEWTAIPDQNWTIGVPVLLDLAAHYSGPDGGSITYRLSHALPPGVTMNGSVISGSPTEAFGPTRYVAIADDGAGKRDVPHVRASPNPSHGSVLIDGERASGVAATGTLQVFTVTGQLAYQRSTSITEAKYQLEWDGRGADGTMLPSGVYLVVVTAGSETARTRLVLTR